MLLKDKEESEKTTLKYGQCNVQFEYNVCFALTFLRQSAFSIMVCFLSSQVQIFTTLIYILSFVFISNAAVIDVLLNYITSLLVSLSYQDSSKQTRQCSRKEYKNTKANQNYSSSGSIPVGDSEFFFVSCSCHVDHIISHFFTVVKIYHNSLVITCISSLC